MHEAGEVDLEEFVGEGKDSTCEDCGMAESKCKCPTEEGVAGGVLGGAVGAIATKNTNASIFIDWYLLIKSLTFPENIIMIIMAIITANTIITRFWEIATAVKMESNEKIISNKTIWIMALKKTWAPPLVVSCSPIIIFS